MMTDRLLLLSTCWILQDELENLLTCFLTGWVEILWFVSDPLPSFIYSLRRRAAIVSQISSSAVFVTTAGDCYQMTHQRLTGGWFLSAHFSLLHRFSVSFPPSWKFFFSLSLSLCLTVSSLRSCQLCSLSSSLRLLSQISVFVHGGVTHRAAACPDLQRRLMLW